MIDVLTDPKIWLLVITLSIIGALARLPNYYAGFRGKDTIESLYPRIKPETWRSVLRWYQRLGPLPLLISSIPFIGTLLTISAGMAGVGRIGFVFWVIVSKVIRNWIILLLFWRLL